MDQEDRQHKSRRGELPIEHCRLAVVVSVNSVKVVAAVARRLKILADDDELSAWLHEILCRTRDLKGAVGRRTGSHQE